ncbi:DUF1801 domain-containing protein [Anderseniella sp. Alg231-50]|uniref:DUF1801 domain-containing protein n=1 Tax=Anderseniella sp. Alg231-50 TaxID=1922226 RepID=UPI000D54B25A
MNPKAVSGREFADAKIRQVFESFDMPVRERLLELRQMIIDEAGRHPEIGEMQETLKWGQPSYLPVKPRIGTTIRLGQHSTGAGKIGFYFSCNSTLADDYQQLYSGVFEYEGRRAILIDLDGQVPEKPLRHCIALALTYHLNKKR